jgi:hypothetical protein
MSSFDWTILIIVLCGLALDAMASYIYIKIVTKNTTIEKLKKYYQFNKTAARIIGYCFIGFTLVALMIDIFVMPKGYSNCISNYNHINSLTRIYYMSYFLLFFIFFDINKYALKYKIEKHSL